MTSALLDGGGGSRWLRVLLWLVATAAARSSSAWNGATLFVTAQDGATSSSTVVKRRLDDDEAGKPSNDADDADAADCLVCHITRVHAILETNEDNKHQEQDNNMLYSCATTHHDQSQHQPQQHRYELVLNQLNEQAHGPAIDAGDFYACIPLAHVVVVTGSSSSRSGFMIVLPDHAPLLLPAMTSRSSLKVQSRRPGRRRDLQQQQQDLYYDGAAANNDNTNDDSSSSSSSFYASPPPPTTREAMVQLRTGVKKMLVVRLVTTFGEEPDESLHEIQGAIFGTGPLAMNGTNAGGAGAGAASVVDQYHAASLGALRYQPLTGAGHETGVLQVTLDLRLTNAGIQSIAAAILNATALALGLPKRVTVTSQTTTTTTSSTNNAAMVNLPPSSLVPDEEEEQEIMATQVYDLAHHTIFCLPSGSLLGGSPEWTAFTYLYEPYSYYQRGRCTALSVVMHEIGHALGFRHSGGRAAASATETTTTSNNSDTTTTLTTDNSTVVVEQEEEEEDIDGDGANNNPYSDETGYMGYSIFQKGLPRKGFNAHKNWISGWIPQQRLISVNTTVLMMTPSAEENEEESPLFDDTDPLVVLQSTETITTITTGDAPTTPAATTGAQAVSRLSTQLPRESAVAVGRLVSFVDGKKMLESNDALVLEIETPASSSANATSSTNNAAQQYFYLQYNRAKGFNQDTAHRDTVTVIQANHETQVSYLQAALSTGQSHRVEVMDHDALSTTTSSTTTTVVVVTVCSLGSSVMDGIDTLDYARVAIHVERLAQETGSSTSSSSFDPCQTRDNAFGRDTLPTASTPTTTVITPSVPVPVSHVLSKTQSPTSAPKPVGPKQQPSPMDGEQANNGDEQPRDFFADPSLPTSSVQDDNDGDESEQSFVEQLFSLDTTVGRLSIIISVMICLVIAITTALLWACRRHVRIERKRELERAARAAAAKRSPRKSSTLSSSSSSPPRKSSASASSPSPPKSVGAVSTPRKKDVAKTISDLQIVEDPTDSTAEEDLTDASDDPLCLSERGACSITSPPPPTTHHHRPSPSGGSGGSNGRRHRPLTPQERRRLQQLRQQQHYHHIQSQLPQHSPYHHHRHRSSRRSSSSSSRRHSAPSSSTRVSPALACSPPAFVDDLSMIEEDPLSMSESSNASNTSSGGGSANLLEDLATDSSYVSSSSGRFGVV